MVSHVCDGGDRRIQSCLDRTHLDNVHLPRFLHLQPSLETNQSFHDSMLLYH